ncbi:MAG: hypothetical protein ACQEXQ_29590 [Bacillota bacterium]
MKQKLVYFSLIILGMLSLLYLMNEAYYQLQVNNKTLSPTVSSFIWMSVLFFIFGILIEWKALYRVIKGKINVRWQLFIFAIILAILTFIPSLYWVQWFGLGNPFYIDILWKSDIRALLTVFSGILLIRSMGDKE